jgi:hypothetical protein
MARESARVVAARMTWGSALKRNQREMCELSGSLQMWYNLYVAGDGSAPLPGEVRGYWWAGGGLPTSGFLSIMK